MKKFHVAVMLFPVLMFTSCELHFGTGNVHYVPWFIIAAFVLLAFVVAHMLLLRGSYKCPECGEVFRPKWYEFSVWLHDGDSRAMKCPKCGRRGFFARSGE